MNYNIATTPLYFVRSGYINIDNGRLGNADNAGYGWSSFTVAYTSVTSATAYYLGFYAATVYPSYGPTYRWNGFPLRWLTKLHYLKFLEILPA